LLFILVSTSKIAPFFYTCPFDFSTKLSRQWGQIQLTMGHIN